MSELSRAALLRRFRNAPPSSPRTRKRALQAAAASSAASAAQSAHSNNAPHSVAAHSTPSAPAGGVAEVSSPHAPGPAATTATATATPSPAPTTTPNFESQKSKSAGGRHGAGGSGAAATLFYIDERAGDKRCGPIPVAHFHHLVASDLLPTSTPVWRPGMPDWQRLDRLQRAAGRAEGRAEGLVRACVRRRWISPATGAAGTVAMSMPAATAVVWSRRRRRGG